MTVLELPERFLNKEKDLKKNISAITLEDETDKKSKSLFQTYSLNKDTLVDDTKVLELPERFKKNDLNVDFEDNSARLYDKPKTDFIKSSTFTGEKQGYIFKTCKKGTGYYLDNNN